MLLKSQVRSAGRVPNCQSGMAERNCQKQSWPQHREADNARWSGDDMMTFGIEVGRISSIGVWAIFF